MEAPPRRANKGKAPDTNSGAFFITLVFPWLGKKTVDKGAGVFQVLYPQFFFRGMDFAHTGAEDEGVKPWRASTLASLPPPVAWIAGVKPSSW